MANFSIATFFILLTIFSSHSLSQTLPNSTISAAPALQPDPIISPSSAPTQQALSPDMYPLFPSPGGSDLSPSDNSLPIIPSSPSPPNPDEMAALGPGIAFAPNGVLPDSGSVRLSFAGCLSWIVVGFELLQLFGAQS